MTTLVLTNFWPNIFIVEQILFMTTALHPFLGDSTGSSKKTLLSSVTHVPSGLMCCALAALGYWVGGRREIQTYRNFLNRAVSAPKLATHELVKFALAVA